MKTGVFDNYNFRNIRCYSCTSLDAEKILKDVQDYNWHKWIENMRYVPNTEGCSDEFAADIALRSGARSQECEAGLCMKLSLAHINGTAKVWRGCIPKSQNQIRTDCTKISSSQGSMELCTCNGHLCNKSVKINYNIFYLITFTLFAYLLN
uniref:UPAR/Ly6 domain-containing protein qvr n=1 Tax=Parastrongyloides trichosuri TaxID=131310 RepID=A0A0N5A3Q9_PARTI